METRAFYAATEDTLTLWWDQPEDLDGPAKYRAELDGETQELTRTHCRFTGLQPERVYSARIYRGERLLWQLEAKTGAAPERVDLTKPPYCAVGDGVTKNTAALQRALDACKAGQELVLPAGVYRTGALRLHSGCRLRLMKDAVLLGTADPDDYLPKLRSRFEGAEQDCYQSLLNLGTLNHAEGPNCRDILLCGEGTIRGGGKALCDAIIAREKELLGLPADGEPYESADTVPGRARGRLIQLSNCENVRITGLNLEEGASWNVHMIYSKNIVTDHCFFRSEGIWNGDGWDPDSSEDCTLFACTFRTGDDSVAIKSGKNPEGNRINRPTRRIRIFDCLSLFGMGLAIGSEMSGGVEDVRIWDCDFRNSLYGVQIKATKKRGGYVRRITVRDCVLARFIVQAVPYNDDGEGSDTPPILSDYLGERLRLTGWTHNYWETEDHAVPPIEIGGFDVPGYEVQNVTLRDCVIDGGDLRLHNCRGLHLSLAAEG